MRKEAKRWSRLLTACVCASLGVAPACGSDDSTQHILDSMSPNADVDPASVDPPDPSAKPTGRYRSIDGTGNHEIHFELGATGTTLRRLTSVDYGDRIGSLSGGERPSPRSISNALCADTEVGTNAFDASDFLWQWGQFVDHDMDLTEAKEVEESIPIPVPSGDPAFDPTRSGSVTIEFHRSVHHHGTGKDASYPRQQINQITHFIDASQVYGSDDVRAAALRTHDGTGRLRVSAGNLLPFNTAGLPNGGHTDPTMFLGGDVRVNEHVGLIAMHTLFVREHNRLAAEIATAEPGLSGETIYQEARRTVGALMQVITYEEFLPTLLGKDALAPYDGYRWNVSPAITNEFSSAIFRFGHSAVSSTLLRVDARLRPIPEGHLPLRDAFFRPDRVVTEGGIEPVLRGLAVQACKRIDTELIDDIRNFLFGTPGAGGLDLASLNVQRGRDHGLPSYNEARWALGLQPRESFVELSRDPWTRLRLASVYGDVDEIDLWVGTLAEDPVNGGHVGEVAFLVIKEQFEALRDGDRYWYENSLAPDEIAAVKSTTLADVIRRNTTIGDELPDDVFHTATSIR